VPNDSDKSLGHLAAILCTPRAALCAPPSRKSAGLNVEGPKLPVIDRVAAEHAELDRAGCGGLSKAVAAAAGPGIVAHVEGAHPGTAHPAACGSR